MSQKIKLLTVRNDSNLLINNYTHESKINAKLHQTYINNMTKNNTHKMQCMDTNRLKKMTGNGSHRMIIIRHILDQVTVLDNKIDTSTKACRHG